MEEKTPLLSNTTMQSEMENSQEANTVSLNRELSLQGSEVDELVRILQRAQELLKLQKEEDTRYGSYSFLPKWLIRYLLLLSLTWQVLCIGILSVVDYKTQHNSNGSRHNTKIASNIVLTVFTAVHLIVVILMTVRVARKVASHTVTFSFLIQSYLSTVLLFAGLFTLTTKFECGSFRHVDQEGVDYCSSAKEKLLIELFIRFLYLSVSNSTLCGITDLLPNKWYTELLVALQMLLSFLYFTSILTQSYNHRETHASVWDSSKLLRALKKFYYKIGS
ncbi:uncharacterized protein [Dysidea avara]|uniref:uncharacterized protein n=1 Tax=Dysidea avara TaxID=196820 RepID=UPI00332E3CA7